MAAFTVDPVEFQLVDKSWPGHKTLQFRHAHLRHVFKHHMLTNHLNGGVDVGPGKSQTFHDLPRHLCADSIMLIKTDPASFIDLGGDRFRHVVKQNGKNEWHRHFRR